MVAAWSQSRPGRTAGLGPAGEEVTCGRQFRSLSYSPEAGTTGVGRMTGVSRARLALLVGVLVLCLAVAGGYLLLQRRTAAGPVPTVDARPTADVGALLAAPRIVFRDTTPGAGYSMLAVTALSDPGGPRADLPLRCDRVYTTARSGVCLRPRRSLAPTYELVTLDDRLSPRTATPLAGPPSRGRISTDGNLVATTVFLTGHSYAAATFSTETVIRRDGRSLANLETWRTRLPDGSALTRPDRNYWGVTFAGDDDTFYATVASGSTTWLVRGSIAAQTMTGLQTDAECPSLSPDGTRVAYKKRLDGRPGEWRLAVLDLATRRETLLAETRSVDDQVEWLDDAHVLYALPRAGNETATSDVWVQPADGSGAPSVLIPGAASPAVVRS